MNTDPLPNGVVRLDLVVDDPEVAALLAFVVFALNQDAVRPVRYTHHHHAAREVGEKGKCRGSCEGRRWSNLQILPMVANVYGRFSDEALDYLESVEEVARRRGRPDCPDAGAPPPLTGLASLMVVLTSA